MNQELLEMIAADEGLRLKPYQDTEHVWTIGYGHNLDMPITQATAWNQLIADTEAAYNDCLHAFPWFADLDQRRQNAVVNMAFNLGITKLLKFKNFTLAMSLGDYETASRHMLDSAWAKQVKGRALRLAAMIQGSEAV